MVARNRGRYLAPIAILVVIAAAILVVRGELASSKHHRSPRATDATSIFHHTAKKAATLYVVKSGDSLSTISVRTGVSVPTLESLNPGINPNALQTGQHLRLRR
jgi:LysM repeat protein